MPKGSSATLSELEMCLFKTSTFWHGCSTLWLFKPSLNKPPSHVQRHPAPSPPSPKLSFSGLWFLLHVPLHSTVFSVFGHPPVNMLLRCYDPYRTKQVDPSLVLGIILPLTQTSIMWAFLVVTAYFIWAWFNENPTSFLTNWFLNHYLLFPSSPTSNHAFI